MSGSNEATSFALISDYLDQKNLKTSFRTVDSGFLSCENLSEDSIEDIKTENIDINQTSFSTEKIESSMKIESRLCSLSEGFSNLKLNNPHINDLSSREGSEREAFRLKNGFHLFQQNDEGDTFLHAAIIQHCPEIALALIRDAPNSKYLDITNDEGLTPLHLAIITDQWRIARWLIIAGVHPSRRNFRGDSPLHIAVKLGSQRCCRAITEPVLFREIKILKLKYEISCYKQVNLDQWDYEGRTCIHAAAVHGHIEILRLLICYGANVNAKEGRSGYTALHYAVESRNERLLYFLLTECDKLDAEATTYAGRSALQLGIPVEKEVLSVLSSKGVTPYCYSEDDLEDSDDDMIHEENRFEFSQLLNGCA